jgi:hypothetical protein
LPALAFLLALSLLTGLVWWRVLHRSDASAGTPCPTTSTSSTPTASITVVPAASSVAVTVLNSTQKTGLAAAVSALLAKDGFKMGQPANDLTNRAPVLGVAEIRYGPTGTSAAKLLSFYVSGAVLVNDGRTTDHIDLAIGAKYTTLTSAATVQQALIADKISQQAPSPTGKSTGSSSAVPTATSPSTTSPNTPGPSTSSSCRSS